MRGGAAPDEHRQRADEQRPTSDSHVELMPASAGELCVAGALTTVLRRFPLADGRLVALTVLGSAPILPRRRFRGSTLST
ncbi:MAG: hypothetical protein JWO88_1656, partial [Frankiales bacterium]|nr:hypothetical protein [Frankiales bacterium]